MQKRAPTLANILVIVLFALSCFGLLLFLWESFGGPVPLKPKGYRFTIAFQRTLALAEQSDVRISGVNVGHVISLKYNKDGLAHAQLEIASKYAPIPANMRAILRQKRRATQRHSQHSKSSLGINSHHRFSLMCVLPLPSRIRRRLRKSSRKARREKAAGILFHQHMAVPSWHCLEVNN